VIVSLDTFLHSADTSCDLFGSSAVALTLERNLICHQSLLAALNLLADRVPLRHSLWNWLCLPWLVVWGPPVTSPHFNPFFLWLRGQDSSRRSAGVVCNNRCGWLRQQAVKLCLEEPGKTPELMPVGKGCRTPTSRLFVRISLRTMCEQTLWSRMLFTASVSNYSPATQTVIKAELNRIQNRVMQQGSDLALMPFSPFPSKLRTAWIWPWRSKMSWQHPCEHKAVSSARRG